MNDAINALPMILQSPSVDALDDTLRQARRMFNRTLANWASDVLLLRQARLHQMTWRHEAPPGWYGVQGHAA